MELYSLFQVSETNEMIILLVLLVMFFAIIYDIFAKLRFFNKMTTVIISGIIVIFSLISGTAIRLVHIILSIGIIAGAAGIFILVALMFILFILIHLGLGKIRRR